MAIIGGGSFGITAMGGQVDMASESLLGSLEGSAQFAPSPFALGGFGAPSFQVGANPMMQILPMLLSALSGLGQGWAGINGGQNFGQVPQQQFQGNASHCH